MVRVFPKPTLGSGDNLVGTSFCMANDGKELNFVDELELIGIGEKTLDCRMTLDTWKDIVNKKVILSDRNISTGAIPKDDWEDPRRFVVMYTGNLFFWVNHEYKSAGWGLIRDDVSQEIVETYQDGTVLVNLGIEVVQSINNINVEYFVSQEREVGKPSQLGIRSDWDYSKGIQIYGCITDSYTVVNTNRENGMGYDYKYNREVKEDEPGGEVYKESKTDTFSGFNMYITGKGVAKTNYMPIMR